MAPSDSHQASVPDVKNPDSEVFVALTELERVSKKNKDFVNDWLNLNMTVQDEIWRGNRLREIKPVPDGKEKECFVPEINIYGPFVNQRRGRKGYLKFQNKTSPCSSRSQCFRKRATSPASTYLPANRFSKIKQTKTKKFERCPMRIAELAVPTKRQCLETWRQKSNVLPEIMVERLKQQVMDQTPIVKIPEAIYCFQRGRFVSSKKCPFKWLSNKIKGYETLQPNHQIATRILCIVFAHKITKILSSPMNIKLNSELKKLSQIVSSDIAKIMPQRQCTFTINQQYEAIHTDISNKIAVWIAGIVQDSAVKLLEEELKVKMKTEAQIERMLQFSKQFYTIFDKIFQPEKKVKSEPVIKSKDLEEEEGPVLDFIDDVVDNVMNLCEPPELQAKSESDSSDYSQDELRQEESVQLVTPIESSNTKTSKLEETFNAEEASQGLTEETDDSLIGNIKNSSDSDHFRNEIGNIIDNITKESENDTKNDDEISLTETEYNITDRTNEEVSSLPEIHEINDDSSKTSTQQDTNDGIYEKVLIKHINDANTNQKADNLTNLEYNVDTLEKTDSNVSERFEIFTDDSGDGTNSKKVMFSKTDLVNPETYGAQIITSTTEMSESDERLQEQWNPQSNKSIIFAEPNEKLLSYADEPWPTDLSDKPLVKLSESANKSVISLGKITENDEKQISSPDAENNEADRGTGDTKLQVNDVMKKIDNMFPTAKHDTARQSKEPPRKAFPKTSTWEPKTRVPQDNPKIIKDYTREPQVNLKVIKEERSDIGKTTTVKPDLEYSKLENYETDTGESNLIRKGSSTDSREDKATPSPKRQSQVGYDWKVHPKTAPSWVSSWGQCRGEPSDDSSIKNQRSSTKVTEYELRKWCKELEKAFKNLEMWSSWISATCKESLLMIRQKEFACPALAQKGAITRIRHKKDVRKDALLWSKLYQRTESNFKSLKRKYYNVEYSSNEPTSIVKETVYDMIGEFENQSMELHKMIVAAECCVVCKCNKSKLNLKKEYNTK